ncbi:unnamed protein product [Polarella glacialis]|uniref:Uncharacterized protein n=1 Tax=Polarella glacialis TaxID=89957 RepID=A0A813I058_POLGL|nr:unnamed protein product [Polarella glacialis]
MDEPIEEKDKDIVTKSADFAAGYYIIPIFTVVVIAATYFAFFTKAAEDSFYYSGMRDRAKQDGASDVGVDFRSFDNGAVDAVKKLQESKNQPPAVPNEKAPEPSVMGGS